MQKIIGQQARVEIRYKNLGVGRSVSSHVLPVEASVLSLQRAADDAIGKLPNNARIISYSVTVEQEA